MEPFLHDFYSALTVVSQDLADDLFQNELLVPLSLLATFIGILFAGFFYHTNYLFPPLKASFWKTSHWLLVMAISALIVFMSVVATCDRNELDGTIPEFIVFGVVLATINIIFYFLVSLLFKNLKSANPMTASTPF